MIHYPLVKVQELDSARSAGGTSNLNFSVHGTLPGNAGRTKDCLLTKASAYGPADPKDLRRLELIRMFKPDEIRRDRRAAQCVHAFAVHLSFSCSGCAHHLELGQRCHGTTRVPDRHHEDLPV